MKWCTQKYVTLPESNLDFEKASAVATNVQMAEKECQLLQSPNNVIHDVKGLQNINKPKRKCSDNFFQDHRLLVFSQNASAVKDYKEQSCPARNWECFTCHRKGYTSRYGKSSVFRNSR